MGKGLNRAPSSQAATGLVPGNVQTSLTKFQKHQVLETNMKTRAIGAAQAPGKKLASWRGLDE